METLAVLARMSVSLVAVLGLMWLIARRMRRSRSAGAAGSGLAVLERTSIGHKAGVAVVRVGDRALVVGVTEQQVSLLSELALDAVLPTAADGEDSTGVREVEVPDSPGALASPAFAAALAAQTDGTATTGQAAPQLVGAAAGSALTGSAVSPATWAKAYAVIRERTSSQVMPTSGVRRSVMSRA
ncbi:flagellar biosynthetic protein FliO, partial [Kineococcus glutinatus]|uniref:flagellar biosynthetic protein FliO n=1 Tax=Kineococcus glutinatus TaxID=1070872 RepID=UPI0031E7C52C